jgi:type II secretory pathway component PulF
MRRVEGSHYCGPDGPFLLQVLVFLYFFMGGMFWLFILGCSIISVFFIICMLTLLLMPLAGLHFCVGLDFVTPLFKFF